MNRAIVDFRDENGAQRTGYFFDSFTALEDTPLKKKIYRIEMKNGEIKDVWEDKIIRITGGKSDKNERS